MPNDMRQGVLRGARAKTGVEGQDVRVAGGRDKHIDRGSFVNYYKDLGISTTAQNAGEIRKEEKLYKEQVDKSQGQINQAKGMLQSQYDSAKSQIDKASEDIPGFKEALSDSWSATKSKLTPVKVVRKEGNKYITEGTYYIPKESALKLAAEKEVATNWDKEGNFYVDVRTRHGRTIGGELHTAFSDGQKNYYNAWYSKAAPTIMQQINAAKGTIGKAEDQLTSSYVSESGKIADAQSQIDSVVSKHDYNWDKIKETYANKKATIAKIFGNMKVTEAKG